MSTTECTDEAGKVLKPSNDNPFIESSQQPNVVDMRGKNESIIEVVSSFNYFYICGNAFNKKTVKNTYLNILLCYFM